jgi:hypothetical protein
MSSSAELAHLFRALKAPAAARSLPKLADRARAEEWSYERFAEALLATEVASRSSSGGELRIRAARFPARKTLEEFDFSFARSLKKAAVLHLAQLDFLHAKENVVLLGPPGTGKTHCENGFSGPGRSLPGCTGGPGMTPKIHWPLATGPHEPVALGARAVDMSARVGGAGLAPAQVA